MKGGMAMRRLLLTLLCCLMLITTVSAAGSVTDLRSSTLISEDGSCEVTLTFQFQLDAVPAVLDFPLPATARDITVNGSSAKTTLTPEARLVDLTGAITSAGTHTVVIHYDLPDAVEDNSGQLILSIELLSGFAYPVQKTGFTVTLPGPPEKKASFTSTYLQESVEAVMDYQVSGSTISCSVVTSLLDRETLTMRLAVSEAMFPQSMTKKWSIGEDDLFMYGIAVLALIYWLLTMRCAPSRRIRRTTEPDGLTAGELGTRLCGQGVDFTMMVISWARMGYLQIHMTDSGRVLLHKRMDMGNERSEFENRFFRSLFGRRSITDGTGFHYAHLCRKASRSTPGIRDCFLRSSGNPTVFRVLSAGVGLVGGICLALAFVNDTAWRVILSILLSVLGSWIAWQIQSAAGAFLLRRKLPLVIAIGCSLVWAVLCAWANEWPVAIFVLVTQWLAGFAAAFGGQRTETGKQTMAEILGLRRYLRSASREELLQALKYNPDYFYTMAPYALALGIDRSFAHRFNDRQLPGCPWLTTGMDGHLTASEWNQLLRDTVTALDERQLRLPFERFTGK